MLPLAKIKHLVVLSTSFERIRWSFLNSSTYCNDFQYEPKFSDSEQQKILNILNTSNSHELLSLNITQGKIKSLENYKKRKGPFKSLNEILEIDGLSVKSLEKLCQQLIADNPSSSPVAKTSSNESKRLKQLVLPQLPSEIISSFVGIHIASTGVSWAKINDENNVLDCWGYQDFGNLPKKMCPTETCQLAVQILGKIPFGDAYVFEGGNSMNLQSQKQSSLLPATISQLELNSMLLALINTSKDHNKHYQDYDSFTNCTYFLKSKLSARLFKTLVGNECVANIGTVNQLLGHTVTGTPFPCTPISLEEESLRQNYLVQSSAHKELLGQALMLTIAFGDLCIRRNPASIKAIAPGKR